MIYADYAYYPDEFHGDAIPEESYNRCAARASDYIDQITMNRAQDYVLLHPDKSAPVKKACCALAEQYMQIYEAKARSMVEGGEIASESVGGHSISYRSSLETAATLEADLRKITTSYLGFTGLLYRGIPNVHSAHCYTDFS